jgi:SAM-dependent methyltransferase
LLLGFAAAVPAALLPRAAALGQTYTVPYVGTPPAVVEVMLRLARVVPDDYVIDLGSGDGRIVIAAAQRHGARGLGVETDGALVNTARRAARLQGVAERVEFREEDLYTTDIGRATIVTLYLFAHVNLELRPRLLATLRPGARIVSHEFDMGGWQPDERATVAVPDKPYGPPRSEVFLWVVPANAAGAWEWRLQLDGAPVACRLELRQSFQMLSGTALVAGGAARLEAARMRGDEIRFILATGQDGRALRQEYSGRISGDAIAGRVRTSGGVEGAWTAARTRRGSMDMKD